MKINFIKTFISNDDFSEKEILGNKVIMRFDAVKEEDGYYCVECSINKEDFNETLITKSYNEWKSKLASH